MRLCYLVYLISSIIPAVRPLEAEQCSDAIISKLENAEKQLQVGVFHFSYNTEQSKAFAQSNRRSETLIDKLTIGESGPGSVIWKANEISAICDYTYRESGFLSLHKQREISFAKKGRRTLEYAPSKKELNVFPNSAILMESPLELGGLSFQNMMLSSILRYKHCTFDYRTDEVMVHVNLGPDESLLVALSRGQHYLPIQEVYFSKGQIITSRRIFWASRTKHPLDVSLRKSEDTIFLDSANAALWSKNIAKMTSAQQEPPHLLIPAINDFPKGTMVRGLGATFCLGKR
jgi:hypothetical protein